MQLRYSYRVYPAPAQREALARAFGCARVVFNDALAARRAAHDAGEPCGTKDGPKPLGVREWTCKECGTANDRDVNAAKNIAALGRREAQNACGGQVRPPVAAAQAREARSRRGAA